MKAKFFFVSVLFVSIFSVIFGYSLVFGTSLIFSNNIKLVSKIGDKVYLDSTNMNNFVVLFSSNIDLSKYTISSSCKINSKFLGIKNESYIFNVKVNNKNCDDEIFYLKDELGNRIKNINIEFIKKYDIYSYYIDLSNESLNKMKKEFNLNLKNLQKYKKYDKKLNIKFDEFYSKYREYYETIYKKNILEDILYKRQNKYISPVPGYSFPTLKDKSKLPNSNRPYRENYTIPIHQGWDIDGPLGTNVSALDDGIIVRIVNNFTKDDFLKINYGNNLKYQGDKSIYPKIDKSNLTYEDKLNNLDILRGNQVWLKTMKGDVVFYSHLDKVFPEIKEGMFIKSGANIGTIGKTGVPGDSYEDYHLHFEVHQNPYDENLAGKYKIEDYLKWDWYFKGKSIEYIAEHQGDIFDLK